MDFVLPLVIGILVGAAIGALLALLVRRPRPAPDETAPLREQLAAAQRDGAGAAATATVLRAQIEQLQAEIAKRDERDRADTADESKVLQALAPVKDALDTMQKKVGDLEVQRSAQHGRLEEQLRTAIDSDRQLTSITQNLASALRNTSVRGAWGEVQLKNLVEASGMLDHVDFDTQVSISVDGVPRRPDLVIHLPGGKSVAVDSKVPLDAYLKATDIDPAATGAEGAQRAGLLKDHAKVLREHVAALGAKNYWSGLPASPELTIAFVPYESAIAAAMSTDPALLRDGFSRNVAIASPVTLWSVLKALAFSWQQATLTDEAAKLFDLTKDLYARLTAMAAHVEKLGRSIHSTVNNYNSFVGSLERNVLPKARGIGAFRKAELIAEPSPIEEPVRELAAPELVDAANAADLADAAELAEAFRLAAPAALTAGEAESVSDAETIPEIAPPLGEDTAPAAL